MKKIAVLVISLFVFADCMAQEQLAFPFQGGKEVMTKFFKDSLTVTQQIINERATGVAVFKFTADTTGAIKKIIIYYADDLSLTQPIITALKKSNHKWIIPDHEKVHDFILPFNIAFTPPDFANAALLKALYDFSVNKKPVVSHEQVPIGTATLLPAVMVKYNLPIQP